MPSSTPTSNSKPKPLKTHLLATAASAAHELINPLTAILSLSLNNYGTWTLKLTGFTPSSPYTPQLDARISEIKSALGQTSIGGAVSARHSSEIMQTWRDLKDEGSVRGEKVRAYGPQVGRVLLAVGHRDRAEMREYPETGFVEIKYTKFQLDGERMFGTFAADEVEEEVEWYPELMLLKDEADAFLAMKEKTLEEAEAKSKQTKEREARKRRQEIAFRDAKGKLEALAKVQIPRTEVRFLLYGSAAWKAIGQLRISQPTARLVIKRVEGGGHKAELAGFSSATPYSARLQARVDEILLGATLPSLDALPLKLNDKLLEKHALVPFRQLEQQQAKSAPAIAYGREVKPILSLLDLKLDLQPGEERFQIEATLSPNGFVRIQMSNIFLSGKANDKGRWMSFWERVSKAVKWAYRQQTKGGELTVDEEAFEEARCRSRGNVREQVVRGESEARMVAELEEAMAMGEDDKEALCSRKCQVEVEDSGIGSE